METKTLIIITPGFPKDQDDSVCLPTQQLFVKTIRQLYPALKINVVSLQYPYHANPYKWNGIDIYPLNGKSKKGILRLLLWYRCYQVLTKITKSNTCVGVISFWCNETALIGNYFSKRKKIKHKIWISGQDARKENSFVKWIKPASHDLVAMSDFLKTEFQRNHGIAAEHVIYNGVASTFSGVRKDIDIIGAGSLIPLKQFNVFVEVMAELRKLNSNISAILIGKGPEENSLQQLIINSRLEENVKMIGEVDHQTLMNLMNRAYVLLHPSQYEGYSTVCLEALANGCHVVSFTYAENTAVKNWHVVNDKKEMISKANHLLNAETDFSPVNLRAIETSAKQMLALFDQV